VLLVWAGLHVGVRVHEGRVLEVVDLLLYALRFVEVLARYRYLLLAFKVLDLETNSLNGLNLITEMLSEIIVLTINSHLLIAFQLPEFIHGFCIKIRTFCLAQWSLGLLLLRVATWNV
jgi:hypothetical protein